MLPMDALLLLLVAAAGRHGAVITCASARGMRKKTGSLLLPQQSKDCQTRRERERREHLCLSREIIITTKFSD